MNKKRKTIVAILASISLVLIMSGVSLAFFSYIKVGTSENTVKSGNITFLYDEENQVGNSIAINDAMPMSDTDGKAQENYFDFKIVSTTASSIAMPYEIDIRKKADSDNLDDIVKIYLAKTTGYGAAVSAETEVVTELYSSLPDRPHNGYTDKFLTLQEVPLNSDSYEQHYRLKMWIDNSGSYDADTHGGKTFTVTVNVYAASNLSFDATDLAYTSAVNPETEELYTACTTAQCAIDELYEIYGN